MIAGPPALPILGHLPAYLSDRLGFLSQCTTQYGDIVKLKLGATTYLLLRPKDIQYVLVTNSGNYEKTPRLTSRRGKRLHGKGLLTSTGKAHPPLRRTMQPMFHRRSIAHFSDVIVGSAQQVLSEWKTGMELDIVVTLVALIRWIMGKMLFGTDDYQAGSGLGDALIMRQRYIGYMFNSLLPFPEYLPTRINLQYGRARRTLLHTIHSLIQQRRQLQHPPLDLLSMLLQLRNEDGSTMTDRQVHDEALTLAITGHETMGEALPWTLYLLAKHPQVERKVWAELREVLRGDPPGVEDLPGLRYTEMVLLESMRLYPPTWIYPRISRNRDRLPSGLAVGAKTKLYLCQYVMHRHPRYFPDPERFEPERFTPEARKKRPKFSYFPFGGGPRICIGEPLAMMQGVLLLASILQRFRLTLLPDQTIISEPGITLRPRYGIRMRLHARNRPGLLSQDPVDSYIPPHAQ